MFWKISKYAAHLFFLFALVLFSGCKSAADKDAEMGLSVPEDPRPNLSSIQRDKYDELARKKADQQKILDEEKEKLKKYESEKQSHTFKKSDALIPVNIFIPDSYRKRQIMKLDNKIVPLEIKIEKIQKRISAIDRKMDQIVNESKRSCFPKDIHVLMADGSYKKISTIKPGDMVMTYDIATDSISTSKTNKVFISPNNHYYTLNGMMKVTAYERFLTPLGWKSVRDIDVGDTIFDGNHYTDVISKTKTQKPLTVYNLNIDRAHNFFVSDGKEHAWLVHNSDHGGGDSGGGSSDGSSGGGK